MNRLIEDNERLMGAHFKHNRREIQTYDDAYGKLWILRDSMGVMGIIRATDFYEAYAIAEDEFFPEATETVDELVEEYGENFAEDENFNEAYGFRPNGPNSRDIHEHGIYNRDLSGESLDILTVQLADELGIEVRTKILYED